MPISHDDRLAKVAKEYHDQTPAVEASKTEEAAKAQAKRPVGRLSKPIQIVDNSQALRVQQMSLPQGLPQIMTTWMRWRNNVN